MSRFLNVLPRRAWLLCALTLASVGCGEGASAPPAQSPAADAALDLDATTEADVRGEGDAVVSVDSAPPAEADSSVSVDTTMSDVEPSPPVDAATPPEEATEREVGPAGGVLEFGGVRLVVPARALTDVRRLRISYAPGGEPGGFALRSPVYRFEPAGTQFAVPASLTMAFDGPASGVSLFWSRADGVGFQPLAGTVVAAGLRGAVEHFSEGFVAEYIVDDCPDDPAKTAPGLCGCGTPDNDTDADGEADCVDGCPDDPERVAPNACGVCAPTALERCDGLDDDCDGRADEGFGVGGVCSAGVGMCRANGRVVCLPDGAAACDAVPGVPAAELCDGRDEDCDGRTDEGFGLGVACSAGVGQCRRPGVVVCAAGGVAACNAVPGAPQPERCNRADDDCDGETDEPEAIDAPLWYRDADSDGHGNPDDARPACAPLDGRVAAADDCDDTAADVNPAAVEACNARDDTCDGLVDEGLADADSDGTPDCRDACPRTHAQSAPGVCGCGALDSRLTADAPIVCKLTDPILARRGADAEAWSTVEANPVTGEVLMAGRFTTVGQALGQAAVFDLAGGRVPSTARIDGPVEAAMPDGAGGWFVGGGFSRVGGIDRGPLVHLLPNGTLDPAWGLDLHIGGTVYALVSDPVRGRLIAAGRFGHVGPHTGSVVRVNARTQTRIESPAGLGASRVQGMVQDAVPDGLGGWFIAGTFSAVGHQPRVHVAHVLPNGLPDPAWDAALEGAGVVDIELAGGVLYLVGDLTRVGGQPRTKAAAIDAATGRVLAWNPTVQGDKVVAVAVTPNAAYLGGTFTQIGGLPRANLAALDLVTGAPLPVALDADGPVNALTAYDGAVFVGGAFRMLAGQARAGLASIEAATGALTAWAPPLRGRSRFGRLPYPEVKTLTVGGGKLFLAGDIDGVGDALRDDACAFDTATGALLPWNDSIDGRYRPKLHLVGDRLFVSPGVLNQNYFIDLGPNQPQPRQDLNIPGDLRAVAAWGDTLLLGGDFESYAPVMRGNVAAFDLRTGALTGFNPNVAGAVFALGRDGDRVYMGGEFRAIGAAVRSNAGVVDATTGLALNWAPEPDGVVRAVALGPGSVYLGGDFLKIENGPFHRRVRRGLAAIDPLSGQPTDFDADLDVFASVSTLLESDDVLFAGGDFAAAQGRPLNSLGGFDPVTGVLVWGQAGASGATVGDVTALAHAADTLFVGGTSGVQTLDFASGVAQPWASGVGGGVSVVATDGALAFVGGTFALTGAPGAGVFVSGSTGEALRALDSGGAIKDVQAATVDSTGRWYVAHEAGLGAVGFTRLARDGAPDPTWRSQVVVRGSSSVNTMVVDERRGQLIVGGGFEAAGTPTGGGAVLDASTGALRLPTADVRFDGQVATSVPDGLGGWFVGGDFSAGAQRYLVHLRADGTLDATWNPSPDAPVWAMAAGHGVLYVGGDFTEVGGNARSRLAALDLVTGAVQPWNPGADDRVEALALDGDVLFIGGAFTQVADQPRSRLAAIEALSGDLTPWDPSANGTVRALVISNQVVYVAGGVGGFSRVGASARATLAALDAATGEVLPWNPEPESGAVEALAVSAGTVYLGGTFVRVNGQPRVLLAAVDALTGVVTPWSPGPASYAADLSVLALDIADGRIFVGGEFSALGGAPRSRAAALDLSTGAASGWRPMPTGKVRHIMATSAGVFLGGTFESPGEHDRLQMLAVDLESGAARPWQADVWALTGLGISDVTLSGDVILASGGGLTTRAGVSVRSDVMAIDAQSGANVWPVPTNLFPFAPDRIASMAVWSGSVFMQSGARGMAIDLSTGALTPWAPRFTLGGRNAANGVNGAVDAVDGLVYISGAFDAVNGLPRAGLAAIDALTGALTPWAPPDAGGGFVEVISGRVHTGGAIYCTSTPCQP